MIIVYGRKNSVNVQKVLWALEESGVDYSRENVGGSFGRSDSAEYRALNPNGVVPTIQHGQLVLWESNAIVRHFARTFTSAHLLPKTEEDLAAAEQWMDWTTSTIWPEWSFVFKSVVRTPEADRDRGEIQRAAGRLGLLYARFDAWLARNSYAAGAEFSMGDIPLGATCYRYFELAIERPSLPNLERWYSRLCERSAYQKAVMVPFGSTNAEWIALERLG